MRSTAAMWSLVAGAAVSACGGNPSSTATTGDSQALTSDAASAQVAAPPITHVPTTAAAPTTAADDPKCMTSELSPSLGDREGGAGQLYQPLVLTNIGGRSCILEGYPDVMLVDGDGNPIGDPASHEPVAPIAIVLGPGETASALLRTTNGPIGGPCTVPSVSIIVVPPDETTALEFGAVYTACGGFSVRPIAAGPTGI